jgi:hypothetical protein
MDKRTGRREGDTGGLRDRIQKCGEVVGLKRYQPLHMG